MKKSIAVLLITVIVFAMAGIASAEDVPAEYTQCKEYSGTYGFGDADITAYTNDDFSAFYIFYEAFGEDQILEGIVDNGIVTVTYDLTGFMSGDAQMIWDDAVASDAPWVSVNGADDMGSFDDLGIPAEYTQVKFYSGTYGFGDADITTAANDDFSAFYIFYEAFGEDQILEGIVENGIVTVTYDLTGFMSGDAQMIWDDAVASDAPWSPIGSAASADVEKTESSEPASAPEEETGFIEEELILKNGEEDIYGVMYFPEEKVDTYPIVIVSHGFGGTADATAPVAKFFAQNGYAAYAFDFIGGSPGSRSGKADGDMTGMSVLTEAEDLSAVIDQIMGLDYADTDHLFLIGQSQGGFISAYVAAQRPEDINAMVLEFPALVLQDDCWERYPSVEDVPEEGELFMGQNLGAIYSLDAMSFDIYDVIGNYTNDVLILHGDKDVIVDLSYSEKAQEVYDHCELIVYEGAPHGFAGDYADRANEDMLAFISAHNAQ